MATWKWISGVEIQGMSTVNCSPATPRSNQTSRPSDATNVASEMPDAQIAADLRSGARNRERGQEARQRQQQNQGQQVHCSPPRGSVVAMAMATIATTEPNSTQVA